MPDNKRFKHFPINSILDEMTVFASLISAISSNMIKYKEYCSELDDLIYKYEGEDYIDSHTYDSINDKLLFRQRELLMLFSEEQKDSFSYKSAREDAVKKGFLDDNLSEDVKGLLKEFMNIRNLTFHNTHSKMIAAKEVAEKSIPSELAGIVHAKPMLNPVIVAVIDKYEIAFLYSLYIHCHKRIDQFDLLLKLIKEDYQELNDRLGPTYEGMFCGLTQSKIIYSDNHQIRNFIGPNTDIIQIAMAIQKGEYDGSQEKYNDAVLSS